MKVQNAVQLRKKYVDYMFELASIHFKDLSGLLDAHEQVDVCKKKDEELLLALQRLEGLQQNIQEDSSKIDSMVHFSAKALKETSNIKQNLTKKLNVSKREIEENYSEMNDLYQGVVLHNASIMVAKLKENELFEKMQQAIDKTDEKFLDFCKSFKIDELTRYQDIDMQVNKLLSHQKNLIVDIDNFSFKQMELKLKPMDMGLKMAVKNLKLKISNHCLTLDHYNETFKQSYAETLKFRVNEVKTLGGYFEAKEEVREDVDKDKVFFANVKNANLNVSVLNEIKSHIERMVTLYTEVMETNTKSLEKVSLERERILKAAINLEELTVKAARQWLELDEDGWFCQTKKYLLNHFLAKDLMIKNLLD